VTLMLVAMIGFWFFVFFFIIIILDDTGTL